MNILYLPLYPLTVVLSFLTAFVPSRVGRAGAWLFGTVAFYLLPNRRRVLAANYAPVLGKPANHPDVQRMGVQSFRNYALYLYEFMCYPHRTAEQIDQRVTLKVGDDMMEATRRGKGLILVSAHFGNMDYTGVAIAKHIMPITVIADMIKPKQLMDHMVRFRGKKGVQVAYGAKAARRAIEALRRNEALGFLVDVGCHRHGGIPVTFFGRRTVIPSGPALLALRTGAPIVVGYTLMVGDRIEAYTYPPIYVTPTGEKSKDVQYYSQLIAAQFEDFIRRYPEQWYIYRLMWKPEDDGAASTPAKEADSVSEPITELV